MSSSSNGSKTIIQTTNKSSSSIAVTTKPPYVTIENVENDNGIDDEQLIIFPQSPYSSHRSSLDKSQCLTIQVEPYSRSQTNSPFLSIDTSANVRRSSTSDIIDKNTSMTSIASSDSRRPSTSELLRRARERKGSDPRASNNMLNAGRIGRSTSQGGLPRAGRHGRRTSMAF